MKKCIIFKLLNSESEILHLSEPRLPRFFVSVRIMVKYIVQGGSRKTVKQLNNLFILQKALTLSKSF